MSVQRWTAYVEDDHATMPCDPQPSWWYDLPPTEGEGVTVDDAKYALRRAIREAEDNSLMMHVSDVNGDGEAFYARRARRLRTALDALTKEAA